MTRKGINISLHDLSKRLGFLSDEIVRAAELLLLSGAFSYATLKSENVLLAICAGTIAALLLFITIWHIGFRLANHTATWIERAGAEWFGNRNARWIAMATVMLFGAVSTAAVLAVGLALIEASN